MLPNWTLAAASASLYILVSGCATEGPAPVEQMAHARTLVQQADKAGAQRYAAADLQRAHDELNQADNAYGQKKYNEAKSLAESAASDADLASARASADTAEHAVSELRKSNDTLRSEADRAVSNSASTPQQ